MKALFIGGTGVISTDCVKAALAAGWEVCLLNRGNRPVPGGAQQLIGDIRNEDAIRRLLEGKTFDVVAEFIGFHPEEVERDIRLFAGKTRQYIYISSASAYQKPIADFRITESTPLVNPYWDYSQRKIQCEEVLMRAHRETGFPVTIVRPSHTYNGKKVPVAIHGEHGNWQILQRILDGKPVIVPGDGTSLWTLTHSRDFAKGFVGLMGNPHTLGHALHITTDESLTWNQIHTLIAEALNKPLRLLHVPSDFLADHAGPYNLRGELLGDKAANVTFDNSKIKRLVPSFVCTTSMAEGIRECVDYMLKHPEEQDMDPEFDAWCDRIVGCMNAAAAAWKD